MGGAIVLLIKLLILKKINPHQLSIILQVNSSTQLQPIRSLIGVFEPTGDVYPKVSREILRLDA